MKNEPNRTWARPATTWAEIIDRFLTYRRIPTWRFQAWTSERMPTPDHISEQEAVALRSRWLGIIGPLVAGNRVTPSPVGFEEAAIRDLVEFKRTAPRRRDCPSDVIDGLWRALLLNRDAYTCCYCTRTAWGVLSESGGQRTLRFQIDHKVPRVLADSADDFDAANMVIACLSCNSIKGQMDIARFSQELESLAVAVVQKKMAPNSLRTEAG